MLLRDVRSVNNDVLVRPAARQAVDRHVTEECSDKAHGSTSSSMFGRSTEGNLVAHVRSLAVRLTLRFRCQAWAAISAIS